MSLVGKITMRWEDGQEYTTCVGGCLRGQIRSVNGVQDRPIEFDLHVSGSRQCGMDNTDMKKLCQWLQRDVSPSMRRNYEQR